MGKHYRDYTIGELLDMGMDITVWQFRELNEEHRSKKQAKAVLDQFEHNNELQPKVEHYTTDNNWSTYTLQSDRFKVHVQFRSDNEDDYK